MTLYLCVPSDPPPSRRRPRRSRWVAILSEARSAPGEWRRVMTPMTMSTATQIASDLRNSHRRDLSKLRVRGVEPLDIWEARWGVDPTGLTEHYFIWLRWSQAAWRAEGSW